MVAGPLDDGRRPGVADAEAFACPAGHEELAARGAVEAGVADEEGIPGVVLGGDDDDPPAAHPLADVVVRLADEPEVDALREEGPEALARLAGEVDVDLAGGRRRAVHVGDGPAEAGPHRPVGVVDVIRQRDLLAAHDRPKGVVVDPVAERGAGLLDRVGGDEMPRPLLPFLDEQGQVEHFGPVSRQRAPA